MARTGGGAETGPARSIGGLCSGIEAVVMADPDHSSVPHRVSVLIAEAPRRDILGAILESAVTSHAGMTLLNRVQASQAGAALRRQGGRCVLLLLGNGKANRAAAAQFLNHHPELVVIRIDVPEADVSIGLRQIGLEQLLETMCILGRTGAPGHSRWLDPGSDGHA